MREERSECDAGNADRSAFARRSISTWTSPPCGRGKSPERVEPLERYLDMLGHDQATW